MNNADVNFNKITDLINSNNEKELKAFEAAKNLKTERDAINFKEAWSIYSKCLNIFLYLLY